MTFVKMGEGGRDSENCVYPSKYTGYASEEGRTLRSHSKYVDLLGKNNKLNHGYR